MHTNRNKGLLAFLIFIAVVLNFSSKAMAQHEEESHEIEEIIVTSALNRSKADTALPVHVLSDENLREQVANTLGETLRNLPGVHTTSFGVGVGQPVIRGLSGNRVAVLQNNMTTADASGVSQDHTSALEPLLAERIEVLRGPATLLYGNGAIGGVVNVIDNRIPAEPIEELSGALEVRANSVNQGKTAVAKVEGGSGAFSWHLNAVNRDADDTDIPGFAIDESLLADHDEDPEEEEEEHEEEENTRGYIDNSDYDADQFTLGGAWHFADGFIGIAVSELNNNYGIPPGAHGHHEEEGEEEEEEEHHDESIRIDMEQRRVDVHGEFGLAGFFKRLTFQLVSNEYEHRELEGDEIGTRFVNDGREGRLSLKHGDGSVAGAIGLQWLQRDFSAIGDEAFIPPVDIESWGLFAVELFDLDPLVLEFGLRWDRQQINTASACTTDKDSLSASASALWRWSEDTNVYATFNRSQRAASVEEAFSNVNLNTCTVQTDEALLVEHAATARVELGNPNLDRETANNLELGFTRYRGDLTWEINAFYNQFSDFIYLADTGELPEETIVSTYLQDDATFYGLEAKATWLLEMQDDAHVDLSLFGDWVRAKLDDDGFIPRIPPVRVGMEIAWINNRWSAKLLSNVVDKQDNIAVDETATDGYVRWDLYADYHWNFNDRELLLFAKLNNLSDEEIRDHTSFLKAFAPSAGRDLSLGLRFIF
jgi:iron complex outermembrane receptor protein